MSKNKRISFIVEVVVNDSVDKEYELRCARAIQSHLKNRKIRSQKISRLDARHALSLVSFLNEILFGILDCGARYFGAGFS